MPAIDRSLASYLQRLGYERCLVQLHRVLKSELLQQVQPDSIGVAAGKDLVELIKVDHPVILRRPTHAGQRVRPRERYSDILCLLAVKGFQLKFGLHKQSGGLFGSPVLQSSSF